MRCVMTIEGDRMDRRDTVLALFAMVVAPLSAEAQRAQKAYRIGYLGNTKSILHTLEAFRQGLRDLGWVEGQSILIEYRWAEGNFDRFPSWLKSWSASKLT